MFLSSPRNLMFLCCGPWLLVLFGESLLLFQVTCPFPSDWLLPPDCFHLLLLPCVWILVRFPPFILSTQRSHVQIKLPLKSGCVFLRYCASLALVLPRVILILCLPFPPYEPLFDWFCLWFFLPVSEPFGLILSSVRVIFLWYFMIKRLFICTLSLESCIWVQPLVHS